MNDHPLRLAIGSHWAGSGKGCAMNVISWENGDRKISDYPRCADRLLARLVQTINDHHCGHMDNNFLCPPCSVEVLALAHRTVGTNVRRAGRLPNHIAHAINRATWATGAERLRAAHQAIDLFYEYYELTEHPTDEGVTADALERMCEVTA